MKSKEYVKYHRDVTVWAKGQMEASVPKSGRKIFLFMMVSLDGYFEGPDHDISWHRVDSEFNDFSLEQMSKVDTLMFGRRTYELMESYWPSEEARQDDPKVAEFLNTLPKIVFSRNMTEVHET